MMEVFHTFNKKPIHSILSSEGEKGNGLIAITRDTRKLKVRRHGWAILGNRVTVPLQSFINWYFYWAGHL